MTTGKTNSSESEATIEDQHNRCAIVPEIVMLLEPERFAFVLFAAVATLLITPWPSSSTSAWADEAKAKTELICRELTIGRVDSQQTSEKFKVSPDSKRLAYAIRRGNKWLVVVDGVEGKEYEAVPDQIPVGAGDPVFSPDSQHVAYMAVSGNKRFVVVDGHEGPPFEDIGRQSLVFSPDSTHGAYIAAREQKWFVVLDGVAGKGFDRIPEGPPIFSPNSKRLAVRAERRNRSIVVVDGIESKEYDRIGLPVFSPDSKRLFYTAWPWQGDSLLAVVDGAESNVYERVFEGPSLFSADSQHLAYAAFRGGHLFVVQDGVQGKGYGSYCSGPVFSPDSKHIAFAAGQGGLKPFLVVVVDGVETEINYDGDVSPAHLFGIVYSPDGKRMAYVTDRGGRRFVVVDGKEGKQYQKVTALQFSPDGKRLAYEAEGGYKWNRYSFGMRPTRYVVVDGVEGKEYDSVGLIVFSPDGKHVVHAASAGRNSLLVVDGLESNEYQQIGGQGRISGERYCGPVFSPDSKRLAYLARLGSKWLVVVDGMKSKEYDGLVGDSSLVFDGPNALHALLRRGTEFLRVELEAFGPPGNASPASVTGKTDTKATVEATAKSPARAETEPRVEKQKADEARLQRQKERMAEEQITLDARLAAVKKAGAAVEAVSPKALSLDLGNGVKLELVLIPAGKFLMGSPESEKDRCKDETQHEVTISHPFYMGKYVVTQEQYQVVMGTNPAKFKEPKNPVEMVRWDDAQEFCKNLGAKAAKTVRLPTEAEWEYACRAGTTTRFYSGDEDTELGGFAWFYGNSAGTTHTVGQKQANPWGLYDMHGDVFVWCADWYGEYGAGPATDPTGPTKGADRVLRGGSWANLPKICRAANRRRGRPYNSDFDRGFRVVVAGPE